MMTREKAREWFLDHMPYKAIMPTAYSAYQNAVAALQGPTREMVERMFPGCDFCKKELDDYPYIVAHSDYSSSDTCYEPGYCPICGRPLTDEAVDMMLEKWKEALREKPL